MALTAGEIEVILRARDDASAAVQKLTGELDKLAKTTTDTEKKSGGLMSAMTSFKGILAGIGISKVIASVVQLGSDLDDLSKKAGINVESLQRLKLAADLNGSSIQSLTSAITMMQVKLSQGEDSTVAALNELGLSLDELRQMAPEEQFIALAKAIQGIPSPMKQAELAVAVGGRAMKEQLAVLKSDVKQLEEGMVAMSARAVAGLDRLDNAWTYAKTAVMGFTGELVANLTSLEGLKMATNINAGYTQKLTDEMTRLTDEVDRQTDAMVKAAGAASKFGAAMTDGLIPAAMGSAESIANVNKVMEEFDAANKDNEDRIRKNISAWERYNEQVRDFADILTGRALAREVKLVADGLKAAGGMANLSAEGWRILNEKVAQFREQGAKLPPELDAVGKTHLKLNVEIGNSIAFLEQLKASLSTSAVLWRDYADAVGIAGLNMSKIPTTQGPGGLNLPGTPLPMFSMPSTGGGAMSGLFKSIFSSLPQTVLGALMGGGGVGKSIGGMVGGALSGVLGKSIGGAIGSIIPGLGTMLGAGLGGFISKIFGPSQGERTNDDRDSWMAQMGGLQKIQKLIADFGNDPQLMGTFDRLYNTGKQKIFAKNAEEFEKRLKELMGEREDAQQRLNAAIQKYGFTVEELGPKWRQQQLTEQAKELILDFTALTASGIDINTVIEKMGTAINEFIALAMKTGSEVPTAMKPMLQKMIEMGLLTDASGNLITDLGESGIKFAETLTEGFDRVVSKLDELIKRLTDDLGQAISNIPEVNVPVRIIPRLGGGDEINVPQLAGGGYVPARPGGTLVNVGEGGEGEYVVPASRMGGGNTFNIYAIDSRSFQQFLRDGGATDIARVIEENPRGVRSRTQQALGLAVR